MAGVLAADLVIRNARVYTVERSGRGPARSPAGAGTSPGPARTGGEPFAPGQRIGLQVAVAAYTSGGAYACFREAGLGRITPGRAADLVAVSPDPFLIEPEQIRDRRVDLTIAAGQVCHRIL